MLRIMGLNPIAVIVAAIAFFFVGFLWYGVLFMDVWMEENNVTADNGSGGLWMLGGFLITALQVIGLGKILQWRKVDTVTSAATTALFMWLFLALPFVNYAYLYLPSHNSTLLLIDASHFLVGWILSAVILQLFNT